MNILGNIKKVITSYSNPNDILNSNQNISNTQGSANSSETENNSTISLLKDESKFLKEKLNQLLKENELLKQSIFTNSNQNNSQITKIFKEFKSAFFSYDSNNETNKSIRDFKNFLFQNILLYNSVEEEDVDVLNAVNISDNDWNNNKDIFIFKQNLLERNYNHLMENLIVSNELNSFLKENNLVPDKETTKFSSNDNQEKPSINSNYNESNSNENKNTNSNKERSFESDRKSENTKIIFQNKTNPFDNANDRDSSKQAKSNILEDLIKNDDLQTEAKASIFSKSNKERLKVDKENIIKPNFQAQAISDNNSKQNSNKTTLKFDELLEPDMDFINIKDNLSREMSTNNINNINYNRNFSIDDQSPIKSNIKSSTNTTEIISNILKDKKVDLQSLVKKTLTEKNPKKNENRSSNLKQGRIKSPLDDEEDDNDEYLNAEKSNTNEQNELNTNNIQNAKTIENIWKDPPTNVIENVKKDFDKVKEKQKENEKDLYTASKSFEDLEGNNLNYAPKFDVKETVTPFNTPMNSEYFSEPKSLSNMELGNYFQFNNISYEL